MKEGFFSKAKELVKKAVKTGVLIGATGAAILPKESEAQNKHQKNNERAPIEVNDSNDSRLNAYNDSLNLYKAYKFQKANQVPDYDHNQWYDKNINPRKIGEIKKSFKSYNFKKFSLEETNRQKVEFKKWVKSDPNWSNDEKKLKEYPALDNDASLRNLNEFKRSEARLTPHGRSSIRIAEYYESLGLKPEQIAYYGSPDVVHNKIKPIADYFDGVAWSPVYKKPIQPYVYKEKIEDSAADPLEVNQDTLEKNIIKDPINKKDSILNFRQGYEFIQKTRLRPGYYTDAQVKEATEKVLKEKIMKAQKKQI